MANAMPQAIGAALGTGRQSIALCGDGGFTMLMGELLTAAELDLPVKLMIFNNSTRGMVRAEMEVAGYVPWGTDVKNPNFGALAQAVGIHGERVETCLLYTSIKHVPIEKPRQSGRIKNSGLTNDGASAVCIHLELLSLIHI